MSPLGAMNPGTVIDPLNHSGQFTAIAVPKMPCSQSSSILPLDLCKMKGVPVIISLAASNIPWWALTTGTGYLLLNQCDACSPLLASSLVAGGSYALGQQATRCIKNIFKKQTVYCAAQMGLAAACLGLSYYASSPLIDDACIAASQAIGLHTALELSNTLLPKRSDVDAFEGPTIQNGFIAGGLESLQTLAYSSLGCLLSTCNSAELAQILLYEQAYRLAQAGCEAAQQLCRRA